MKILSAVAIAIFLVTTLASSAQAAGTRVGFVPMFTRANPDVPMEIQSRITYNRMLPELLSLQRRGVITEFEPSFSSGVVKVISSGAANLPAIAGMQSYSDMNSAMAAVPQLKSLRSDTHTGPLFVINPEFEMSLYDNCFNASGLGGLDYVVGKLQDKSMRVVATFAGSASQTGYISGCFSWDGAYGDVTPGFRVTFDLYLNSSLLSHVAGPYQAVAPSIKFTTVNKATAVVGGTGPAGKHFVVYWDHPDLNAADSNTSNALTGTISGSGAWSKDMSISHFRGGDFLEVAVLQNPQFTFSRNMAVPLIVCTSGGDSCELIEFASYPASLSIHHLGVTHTISGQTDQWGYISESLMNSGNPTFLKAGDKAWGTLVSLYTLPKLTDSVDFSTNFVSGKAPANKYFQVWVDVPFPSNHSYVVWSHSNGSGNYLSDFTSQVDLLSTTGLNFQVDYQDPTTGNATEFISTYSP